MFKSIDFTEEKERLEREIQEAKQGKAFTETPKEAIRFKEIENDIEEFIDSVIRGVGPFRLPYTPQRDSLICLKTLQQLKAKSNPSIDEINVFLIVVKQDLGIPTFDYIYKMIFEVKNG